jgi:hypothetical protein
MSQKTLSTGEEDVQRQMLDELQQQQDALRHDLPQQGVPGAWLTPCASFTRPEHRVASADDQPGS